MRRRFNSQNLLSVAAIVLAAIALARTGGPGLDGAAVAGAGEDGGPFNATEQRNQIIAQQRETNARLARMEQAFKTGVHVKVMDASGQ